jgi:hypothetical protein
MLKKIVAAIVTAILGTAACAAGKDLYVIQFAPPGGNYDRMNQAITEEATKRGYQVTQVQVTRCKGIEAWIKDNPNKPAIHAWDLTEHVASLVDPNHPTACDLRLNKDRIISLNFVYNMNVCTMSRDVDAQLKRLLTDSKIKVGQVKTNLAYVMFLDGLMKDLNPSAKLIRFNASKDQAQALLSGDIDFATTSVSYNLEQVGATCIASSNFGGQFKGFDLSRHLPKSSWARHGTSQGYLGYNINVEEFRGMVRHLAATDERFLKQYELGATKAGILAGTTGEEQWKWVQNYYRVFVQQHKKQ